MKKLLFVVALSVSIGANAQVSFGPEIGFNGSGYATPYQYRDMASGVRAGGQAKVKLAVHFDMLASLFYVDEPLGPSRLIGGSQPVMSIHCMELPVNVVYKHRAHGNTPYIGAGVYTGMNISGKTTNPPNDIPYIQPLIVRPLKVGSAATDDIKRLDAGMSVTAGIMLANGFYIRILFQKGFVNLLPVSNDNDYMRRNNLGIGFGYLFHHHAAKPQVKSVAQ